MAVKVGPVNSANKQGQSISIAPELIQKTTLNTAPSNSQYYQKTNRFVSW